MAHEITDTDSVGIVGGKGWHGLGTPMPAGQSALEALESLGLDWEVVERTLWVEGDKDMAPSTMNAVDSHKALVRSDTKEPLGVVGANWCPMQNRTLAAIADSLGEGDEQVHCDTAGSLKGGKAVFIGLRGETTIMGGDETYQYLLLANRHDGMGSLRIHPTATRVVCMNTYAGSEADSHLGYAWRHTAGLKLRQDEIISVLKAWRGRMSAIKAEADTLAALDVNSERVSAIMVAVYEATTRLKIPTNPTTAVEQRRLIRATDAIAYMQKVFDTERSQGSKPSVWLAANSTTNWIQHVHGRLDGDNRTASCVLGTKAVETAQAMRIAQTVGVA